MLKPLFLDTETTGNEEGDRLVQLAWYTDDGGFVNEYFKPSIPIKYGAMAVHHITNSMVADKGAFVNSTEKTLLENLLKEYTIVAHNADFDVEMLRKEGLKIDTYIDTLKLARKYIEADTHQLQALRYQLDLKTDLVVKREIAHDAEFDVALLRELYKHLVNRISEEEGEDKVEEILLASCQPSLIDVMAFGKHKGKAFEEIAKYHLDYLQWLWDQPGKREKDLEYTLRHYLYPKKSP